MLSYTALGDSIAWGMGAPFTLGYTHHLKGYLRNALGNVKYRNLSALAATSSFLLNQLRCGPITREIVARSSILTISMGGNNLLKGSSGKYRIIDESAAQQWLSQFAYDWPKILGEVRFNLGFQGRIYVMTLYNPCRLTDYRFEMFDIYINQLNSIIADNTIISTFNYSIVDVYGYFQTNFGKNWTHFYDSRSNPHPNSEGHRQIAFLHKHVIGI